MRIQLLTILAAGLLLTACNKGPTNPPVDPNAIYFPPLTGTEWTTITPESLNWNTAEIPALQTLLRDNGTRAFIVLVNGRIVMEYYFGNNTLGSAFTRTSNWYWASAGKTLTSFVVGKAQEGGFLNLNDPVSKYLGKGWTSCTEAQENAITVRHQLTMTTGLDDGVLNSFSTTPADLKYKAAPGTRWAYHNAPYTLLDQVVTNAVGKPFADYFNEQLRNKIGMDGFWLKTGDNNVYYSTARAMARYGLLMLNNGKWSDQILINSSYFNAMINTSQHLNKSYGYLWWLNGKSSYMLPSTQLIFNGMLTPNAPADMYSGLGKNGQYLNVIPSKKMVVVRMGESPDGSLVAAQFQDEIWSQLKKIIK
jgi:CubicO group peptidase (beta-lactamase class C family)